MIILSIHTKAAAAIVSIAYQWQQIRRKYGISSFRKKNIAAILDKQLALRAKKKEYGFIAVGSGTDAYIHHEEKQQQTLEILKIILKNCFPFFISTKCTLITRNIDLLKEIDKKAIIPEDLKSNPERGVIISMKL